MHCLPIMNVFSESCPGMALEPEEPANFNGSNVRKQIASVIRIGAEQAISA